ncbi:hypothetical protein PLEOSDRAFT_1106618 [Pleurotus ostreatus PC15]|uniref:Uncharacterized protein n=1 Tax=Pleurotus ostreatus (strain PC15) TaxID=1137138 RepID=A0A067NCF8_PLEO1|nr:hypothetical protein PLEOSDRAFT_1106618 [Pleurotus ostreatus PC15]
MADFSTAHAQPPPSPPLELPLAPPVSSTSSLPTATSSSLSPLPLKSKLPRDSDGSTTVPPHRASTSAQTINITTLNVTYGDHYGGAIHNGCIGGRRNENENYFDPPSHAPPPALLIAVDSAALGLAFGVAGIAAVLMLLRR